MRAALYARYSTDKQSGASIADQLRVCTRIAERNTFAVAGEFTDAAISGGTAQRPGYQAMLEAARRGELDVIVAEDTSRLWRNLAEQAPRVAELADLGVHVVTQDLDTRSESAGMLGAVLGASSEAYRREIGRRVRRGLEGLARNRKSTGGRAYGYLSATESPTGERVIEPARAAIVREIFARFAAGETLRAIASDLNARRIPSPGAGWNRERRTVDRMWRVSALHTLLQNYVYTGRVVWNRSKWVRSASDSSVRRRVENPPSEWIVQEHPELRIVDQGVFEIVRARFAERAELFGSNRGGRATYLLSGLLRCGVCGGAFIVAAHRPVRYGCATHRQAGPAACTNAYTVSVDEAEPKIIARVQADILSPDAVAHGLATMRALAKAEATAPPPELAKLDFQITELERLRAEGVLSAEIAGAALARAHRDREAAARPSRYVEEMFGGEAEYRQTVADMREALQGDDKQAARNVLRMLLQQVRLYPEGDKLMGHFEGEAARIALAVGGNRFQSAPPLPIQLTAYRPSTRRGRRS